MNLINDNIYTGIKRDSNVDPNNITGWNSYNSVFNYVIEKIKPRVIIEVGSWLGASAINMVHISKKLNLNPTMYCVDTWLGSREFWTLNKHTVDRDLKLKNGYPSVYYEFLKNVVSSDSQNNIIPIPNTSSIGAKILEHYRVTADLIYIDGSHELEDVKADVVHYLKLLNENGIMFGDDYNFPSVRIGVQSIIKNKIEVYDNKFWIYQKTNNDNSNISEQL